MHIHGGTKQRCCLYICIWKQNLAVFVLSSWNQQKPWVETYHGKGNCDSYGNEKDFVSPISLSPICRGSQQKMWSFIPSLWISACLSCSKIVSSSSSSSPLFFFFKLKKIRVLSLLRTHELWMCLFLDTNVWPKWWSMWSKWWFNHLFKSPKVFKIYTILINE